MELPYISVPTAELPVGGIRRFGMLVGVVERSMFENGVLGRSRCCREMRVMRVKRQRVRECSSRRGCVARSSKG
ncbi:unnamed protein product [Toxocara canis]|uniref:Uncharacterized protein n=1 Tax=Toxocara canis TaxID=6265 RepID=A0A183VF05_TOXCA|nr:unnamed protein product [Toxocara canis]